MIRLNIVVFSDLTFKLNRMNITDLITDRMHENLKPGDINEFEKYRWLVEMIATEHHANQAKDNEVLDLVSGCLICIMDNVEGDGLTEGMRYKILAEKDGMYCIIDDNNNLGVYGEIFFDKE